MGGDTLTASLSHGDAAGDRQPGRRRHILFCTFGYVHRPIGGAERQAQSLAEELARRGHQVEVVCPRRMGTQSGRINRVWVRRLPIIDARPLRTFSYLTALLAFLLARMDRFDLAHVHLAYFTADVVALAALVRPRPFMITLACGGKPGEIWRMRHAALFTRYLGLRRASYVQALSNEIGAEARQIGIPPRRVVRIPNGVSVRSFHAPTPAEKRQARLRLGLPAEQVVALFAGRFDRQKGIEYLLAAWNKQKLAAMLVLVGSYDTYQPVAPVEPATNLLVREWAANIQDYYQAADLFVLPSLEEGMANVILEAMATGLAVIATRTGAAEEVIEDGLHGLLVEPRDSDGLARALADLVADEGRRDRLGRAALDRVAVGYSIEQVVGQLEATYERMCAGPDVEEPESRNGGQPR